MCDFPRRITPIRSQDKRCDLYISTLKLSFTINEKRNPHQSLHLTGKKENKKTFQTEVRFSLFISKATSQF